MRTVTQGTHCSHLALTTIGFGGLQAVFALFSGQAVSHLQSVGLSRSQISLALLSGPICGALFQPAFGSWSDKYVSHWGRRKPFIIPGVIVLALSILSLAWLDVITQAILPRTFAPEVLGQILVEPSIVLTFIVFVAVQAVHVGLRALITDDCTPAQQSEANTWAGRHSSFGGALAFLTAYLDVWGGISGLDKTVFSRAAIPTVLYLLITVAVTCYLTKEQPAEPPVEGEKERLGNAGIIRTIFLGESSQIRTIYLVQFLSWLGMFPFLYYTVTYVDSLQKPAPANLMMVQKDGNTQGPGHDIGALTLLVYSLVSMFAAMVLPRSSLTQSNASRHWTAAICTGRGLWVISQLCFTTAMLGTFLVSSAIGTVVLFSLAGITFGINAIVPFALLGDELSRPSTNWAEDVWSRSQGLVYGLNNLAVCLPQIIIICIMGLLWQEQPTKPGQHGKGGNAAQGVVWFLRVGGFATLVAAYFVTRLQKRARYEEIAEYENIPLEAELPRRQSLSDGDEGKAERASADMAEV